MKKIFTYIMLVYGGFALAQSSLTLYDGTTTLTPIPNGGILANSTVADGETINRVKIRNMSASQHTYSVKRTIVYQAPLLNVSGSTVTPNTYFCAGNTCFGNSTSQTGVFDYTILLPAGQTSTVFPYSDESDANGQIFKIYFEEGSAMGKYFVKYKVWEVNNPNDSSSFTIKYNEFLNVNSLSNVIDAVSEVYPNPTSSGASVNVVIGHEADVKIGVYNTLGSLVNLTTQKCVVGKNKLSIDCNSLNNGMYFVSIQSGDSKITKRLIVNK